MRAIALGYVRVSGSGQAEKHGPQRQRESIERVCERFNLELAEVYMEAGVCGETSLDNRTISSDDLVARLTALRARLDEPQTVDAELASIITALHGEKKRSNWKERAALKRMLADIKARKYGDCDKIVVVVEKLDRFARKLRVQEEIIEAVARTRATITSEAEGDCLESTDPSRVFVRQIWGVVAQYDKATIVSKLASARKAKRKSGQRCEGRKPFGHNDKYPQEQECLKRIGLLLMEGKSCTQIAAVLTSEGFVSRSGKPFNSGSVWKIMQRCKESMAT